MAAHQPLNGHGTALIRAGEASLRRFLHSSTKWATARLPEGQIDARGEDEQIRIAKTFHQVADFGRKSGRQLRCRLGDTVSQPAQGSKLTIRAERGADAGGYPNKCPNSDRTPCASSVPPAPPAVLSTILLTDSSADLSFG